MQTQGECAERIDIVQLTAYDLKLTAPGIG
jgi:hypothetical protein